MNRNSKYVKKVALLVTVVSTFAAVAAADASASSFEYSSTGSLSGRALNTQVLTTNGGQVKCTTAKTTGTMTEKVFTRQNVKVEYSGCTAFGFASVTISPAEYTLFANGEVSILDTIKISVPLGGCSVSVGPQSGLKSISYENNSGKVIVRSALENLTYTSTGGLCGSSGSNGKYSGNNEVELVGGTMKFIP